MNTTPATGGDSPLVYDPNEVVTAVNAEHVAAPRRQPLATATSQSAASAAVMPSVAAAAPAPVTTRAARVVYSEPAPAAAAAPTPIATPPIAVPVPPPVAKTRAAVLPLVSGASRIPGTLHEDVYLPSQCLPYAWKDIQVRRFNVEEIRAIIRARNSGNLRHLIRAVDATLTRPVTDLTMGDFWFLMYWHRLNSYKKAPFIIQWSCNNPEHLDWVEHGRDVDGVIVKSEPESLRNLLTIAKSNLVTPEIDLARYQEVTERLWQEYGLRVRPQGVVDFINAIEEDSELVESRTTARRARDAASAAAGDVDAVVALDEIDDAVDDEDRGFMYRYAALLDPEYHGTSLQDRVAWLATQAPDMLVDLEEVLEVTDHGVTESWNVTCKECAHQRTINQSLDALTFLPSLQRRGLA